MDVDKSTHSHKNEMCMWRVFYFFFCYGSFSVSFRTLFIRRKLDTTCLSSFVDNSRLKLPKTRPINMEVRISQTDVKVIEELEEGGRGVANKPVFRLHS